MIHLQKAIFRLDLDLRALGSSWAIVGGVAVAVRGTPRFTNDVDVAIAVSGDREAESLALALRGRGYTDYPLQPFTEGRDGRLSAARMLSPAVPESSLVVDLLFAFSGIEREVVQAAELVSLFEGLPLPVVRTGHLLALKVHAGRPKDLEDARELLKASSDLDLQAARDALDLIERRGFVRGDDEDLQRKLSRLAAEAGRI